MRALLLALFAGVAGGYELRARLAGDAFLDAFDFIQGDDSQATHGYVLYQSRADAEAMGLAGVDDGNVFLSAGRPSSPGARVPSVRIEGAMSLTGGVLVLDLLRMPVGCATWPAYWLCNQTDPAGSPSWPAGGEIDVLEGVHLQASNAQTLHTLPGCVQDGGGNFTGETVTTDCASGTGCGIWGGPYGADLNAAGGGVLVTEWDPAGATGRQFIRSWFLPRGSDLAIQATSNSSLSQLDSWPAPNSYFDLAPETCDGTEYFFPMKPIFDIAFCGSWAGEPDVWASSGCQQSPEQTCVDYLTTAPDDYWLDLEFSIGSLGIFQTDEQFGGSVLPQNVRQHGADGTGGAWP